MEKSSKPLGMNVLPLINKALALFQWKNDFSDAEKLCEKALIIDPECDIAVATMAQLLLQQGKVTEALKYFERAAELSRTEGEIVNALSYAEATRTQLEVSHIRHTRSFYIVANTTPGPRKVPQTGITIGRNGRRSRRFRRHAVNNSRSRIWREALV
jgi:tetratricopeptide (TPR) repeat protein